MKMLPYMAPRDFADVTNLRILRWEEYTGLFRRPSVIARPLTRTGSPESEKQRLE